MNKWRCTDDSSRNTQSFIFAVRWDSVGQTWKIEIEALHITQIPRFSYDQGTKEHFCNQ